MEAQDDLYWHSQKRMSDRGLAGIRFGESDRFFLVLYQYDAPEGDLVAGVMFEKPGYSFYGGQYRVIGRRGGFPSRTQAHDVMTGALTWALVEEFWRKWRRSNRGLFA